MKEIEIGSTTAGYPELPYEKIKSEVLGNNYKLSLVFIGKTRAQQLNYEYRKKSYVPNVLSFPLGKDSGEIYITPSVAKTEAKLRNMSERGYIGYLFIHALLHLKGHDHGATMEKAEKRLISKYELS